MDSYFRFPDVELIANACLQGLSLVFSSYLHFSGVKPRTLHKKNYSSIDVPELQLQVDLVDKMTPYNHKLTFLEGHKIKNKTFTKVAVAIIGKRTPPRVCYFGYIVRRILLQHGGTNDVLFAHGRHWWDE